MCRPPLMCISWIPKAKLEKDESTVQPLRPVSRFSSKMSLLPLSSSGICIWIGKMRKSWFVSLDASKLKRNNAYEQLQCVFNKKLSGFNRKFSHCDRWFLNRRDWFQMDQVSWKSHLHQRLRYEFSKIKCSSIQNYYQSDSGKSIYSILYSVIWEGIKCRYISYIWNENRLKYLAAWVSWRVLLRMPRGE